MYIESFGNSRKFARTARRVSAAMPVLTVQAEPAAPQALFEQAGVITTRGFGELVETAALLATQPVPAGRTVAIVSNVGSAGTLAADACADLGLSVHHPHGQARRRLHALAAEPSPVRWTPGAPVSAEAFRQCLELLAADDEVNAVLAIVLPTGATGDLEAAIQQADMVKPLAAVVLTQTGVRFGSPITEVPAYGSPEAAVRALARAAGYGAWRAAPRGQVPALPDVRTEDARALVRGSAAPAGSARPRPPSCCAATASRWPTWPRRARR